MDSLYKLCETPASKSYPQNPPEILWLSGPSLLPFQELADPCKDQGLWCRDLHELFKDNVSNFLSQTEWFVTNSHHNDTLTGLSADPDLQAFTQTAVHRVQRPHISKLLLLVESNKFPCALSLPCLLWRDYIRPLQHVSVMAHAALAPPACFLGCMHFCMYSGGQCSFAHFYHSWGNSLVPIVLHLLFSTHVYSFLFNCHLQSPSPIIPGINTSSAGWPARWQRCPCSTLSCGSHLFLGVIHLQRGSHGCKSELPGVDICVRRCSPADLHPPSDLALGSQQILLRWGSQSCGWWALHPVGHHYHGSGPSLPSSICSPLQCTCLHTLLCLSAVLTRRGLASPWIQLCNSITCGQVIISNFQFSLV